jgi:CHAD domain-containing protein
VAVRPKRSTGWNVRRIVATRVDELFERAAVAMSRPADAGGWHDVRIAAKRLRYTLELFPRVVGEPGDEAIATLKAIQDELGALQDLEVLAELVADELRAIAGEEIALAMGGEPVTEGVERAGLLAFLARVMTMREERRAAFVARWEALVAEGLEGRLRALGE